MKKHKLSRKRKKFLYIIIFLLFFAIFHILWSNLTAGTSYYNITSEKLPQAFDGFKIAQISDFHNARFGRDNSMLIGILEREKPDIIVITGDFVDINRLDIGIAVSFARQAVKIAPCYYVNGNHEAWIGEAYQELEEKLLECGVTILHDEMLFLERGSDQIQLIGVNDPDFLYKVNKDQYGIVDSKLKAMHLPEGYKLLLSHRPELFGAYVDNGIDLALTGHAHGGQFRLPFIGGLIAPNQGLFPRYDAGLFVKDGSSMVVSRGIGNSVIPIRINNRPEIVIVNLKRQR